jgi:hypothetical protein
MVSFESIAEFGFAPPRTSAMCFESVVRMSILGSCGLGNEDALNGNTY